MHTLHFSEHKVNSIYHLNATFSNCINSLFFLHHSRSIESGSARNYRKFGFCVFRFFYLNSPRHVIVARFLIDPSSVFYRSFTMARVRSRPSKGASPGSQMLLRQRAVCKSDASAQIDEPQRDGRSTVPHS